MKSESRRGSALSRSLDNLQHQTDLQTVAIDVDAAAPAETETPTNDSMNAALAASMDAAAAGDVVLQSAMETTFTADDRKDAIDDEVVSKG